VNSELLTDTIAKLTEMKIVIDRVTNGKLVSIQNLFRGTGVEHRNTSLLYHQLENISHYIDETNDDIRKLRIEPLIDELDDLYTVCNLSGLSDIESNVIFTDLRQQVSSNLRSRGINPTNALKVVIMDLAVNTPIRYSSESQIKRWASDLSGIKSEWMVHAYLEGIMFENDLKIGDFYFTSDPRQLVQLDERAVNPISEPHAVVFLSQSPDGFPVFYATSTSEIYRILYQISVCIQLYTRTRIRLLMTHLRPIYAGTRDHLHKHWISEEKLAAEYYIVTPDQHDAFSRFISTIFPILNKLGIEQDRFGNDYRSIAIKHFCDAIHREEPLERISAAVVSLEALFGHEHTELLYRLKQRIVRLIDPVLNNPTQILSNVKKAYDIRSAYLHGNKPRIPGNPFLEMLSRILIVSILLILQIDMEKKAFVNMLDEAMICNNTGVALSEWVSEIFNLLS